MPEAVQGVLTAALVVATSIWLGGYVAIVVVARVATATLDPAGRVALFRSLGRAYLRVGIPALAVALAVGAVLLTQHGWDALATTTAALSLVLVGLLAVAVAQARRMTGLRRQALAHPEDRALAEEVQRGGRHAGLLRALLGLLSLSLVVLGSFLAA